MDSSRTFRSRQSANASAIAAFGISAEADTRFREIHTGSGGSVFTVGYERRNLEDFVSELIDSGVECLVDVREKPVSRKPGFSKRTLEHACHEAGIEYCSMPRLGSTSHQRSQLRESGDLSAFMSRFRDFARRGREKEISELAQLVKTKSCALFCYERCHDECHRRVLSDLLAEQYGLSVVAIL